MDKYRKSFESKVKPKMNYESGEYKVEPFRDSQLALNNVKFAIKEREQFFTEAYGEILSDLFIAWLKSEPHAVKEREFFYASAMALGEVKNKLVRIETFGANRKYIAQEEVAKENNDE